MVSEDWNKSSPEKTTDLVINYKEAKQPVDLDSSEVSDSDSQSTCLEPIEHTFEETEKDVIVSLDVSNIQESEADISSTAASFRIRIADGRQWSCKFCKAVVPNSLKVTFSSSKIQVSVLKEKKVSWLTPGKVKSIIRPPQRLKNIIQVKDSFYDKQETIHYVVYVAKLSSADVEFTNQGFTYYFSTKDVKFQSMYPPADGDTIFWRHINTKYEFDPDNSSFSHTISKIEIKLKKASLARWTTVEALSTQSAAVSGNGCWQTLGTSRASETMRRSSTPERTLSAQINQNVVDVAAVGETLAAEKTDVSEKENTQLSPPPPPPPLPPASKPTCVVAPLSSQPTICQGFTGLVNLGNTCFMNSVIQCLVNTTLFRNFFLDSSFQADLNKDNPLGSGGRLAIQFAILVRTLWEGNKYSFSPTKLKNLVAMKASQFTGFAQHDAQEFLAFLLDGLHEDLNRVKDKPYVEHTDLHHLSDEEAARVSWQRYKDRNDSFIVDEFQGQFKSTLVCPACNKVSITFDPYMYVSVPLPKRKIQLTVTFFRKDPKHSPMKYSFTMAKDSSVTDLKSRLSSVTKVPPQQLLLFESDTYSQSLSNIFMSNYTFYDSNSKIFAFELDVGEEDEDMVHIYCIQRVVKPETPSQCAHCHKTTQDLKRCSQCFRVGYCNSECQKANWRYHKYDCKTKPRPIGLPFMVSMPQSQLTYKNLTEKMQAYAKYSVDVFQPPVVPQSPHTHSPTAGGDGSFCSEKDTDPTEGAADATSTAESAAASSASTTTVMQPQQPYPFSLVPVDRLGSNLNGVRGVVITDQGDETLNIANESYLSLDWNNNEKRPPYVYIKTKPLDCVEHESCKKFVADEEENITLEKCLNLFTEPETLDAKEAWYCPNCKEHQSASKQMSLWSLPNILIIQLKRFSFRNNVRRDKIDKMVSYPIRGLDLSSYYCGPQTPSSAVYDLYGIVNHKGGLLGGHYVAYARCLDKDNSNNVEVDWRGMDDSRVYRINNERSVVTKEAYVLFYKRRVDNSSTASISPSTAVQFSLNNDDNDYDNSSDEASPSPPHSPPELVVSGDTAEVDEQFADLRGSYSAVDASDDDSNQAEPSTPPDLEIDEGIYGSEFDVSKDNNESIVGDNSGSFSPTSGNLGYTDMDDID